MFDITSFPAVCRASDVISSSVDTLITELIKVHLHVTGGGEDKLKDGLGCHPAEGQASTTPVHIDLVGVMVDVARQAEVSHLNHLVVPHEHVPGGQVTVDKPLLCQVLLQQSWDFNELSLVIYITGHCLGSKHLYKKTVGGLTLSVFISQILGEYIDKLIPFKF